MGIGSPPLLGRLVRQTLVVAVAAGCLRPALADGVAAARRRRAVRTSKGDA